VIFLRFWEDLTMAQIGDMMGISESRVSQIVKKALLQLYATIGSDVLSERLVAAWERLAA
jgi:DNA-directed RNA polymerase specialized sigma subunit